MLRQWLIIVIVCICCKSFTDAKLCEDVSVWNYVSEFEPNLRGCSVIVGYLKIVLIEKASVHDYQNLSFPELTEVKGFLLLYRVYGLTSLGKLFPNLSVIRGMTLITDYSFVLHDVPYLREIGLHNLRYIARGSTRIERCPNLCYVDTINWTEISSPSHKLVVYDTNEVCDNCPGRCNGYCWNQNYCQSMQTNNCDPECIGCRGPDPDQCYVCKNCTDGRKCVAQCPDNKVLHSEVGQCIMEKECQTLLNGTWWVFQKRCMRACPPRYYRVSPEEGWCKYCGDGCTKVCRGMMVHSIAVAQKLRGCTHINGSLSIKVSSKSTVDELEENLGMIQEIFGYLKVFRSYPLTSLEFFKKLKVIHGKKLENRRHSLMVFENPNLHKLWDWNNFNLTINNGTIFFHYNSQLCLSEIEKLASVTGLTKNYSHIDVSPFSNGDKTTCNFIELNVAVDELAATSITLKWEHFIVTDPDSLLIGYLLYYIKDPLGNVTIYDESSECDIHGWDSIFVSNNTQQIINLTPHTQYAYYIKTYTSSLTIGGQTVIQHFITLSDDPSIPIQVRANSTSTSTITLTWKTPQHINGILNYYLIDVYVHDDDNGLLIQRNYCRSPHVRYHQETAEVPTDVWTNSTCNATCYEKMEKLNEEKQEKLEIEKFNDFCYILDETETALRSSGCKKYMFGANGSDEDLLKIKSIKIEDANLTKFIVEDLRHYTQYTILLRACNNESQCSSPVMLFNRTLREENADDIPASITVNVEQYDVFVEWSEPENPNAFVASYQIEHKRTDLENSKNLTECVTQREYASSGNRYRMRNFLPGYYSLRVKAISLAGEGKFSEAVNFIIEVPSHGFSPAFIVVPVVIIVIMIVALVYYRYYKRKHILDDLHLITNINPDYAGAIYVEDEWELNRDDLEISNELGQGTFGMVFNGFIKSQNRPCAVKTINEHTDIYDKMTFLNEASIMKSFNDAHHVVKLLGVVSKGQPSLVVMELMARGDLKSFLRRSRESSSTITCAEMYRMAAEIADGMMYLAAKKFVHRDLAARNCMVAADFTVKIGDFGMTRDIYETDYYRKGTRGLMPVRWMSPESLADGVFTSDSDVWSYGVVLWEMVTLAEQPYQGLANEQVLQFVIAQGTLERPPECPDLLYEIMDACWKWRPNHRPLFKDIVEKLEPNVGQNFRLVSFYHSSDGEEYRMHTKDRVYNPPALTVPLSKNSTIHWNTSNDDVSVYSLEPKTSRPTPLLSSLENQSKNVPSGNSYR